MTIVDTLIACSAIDHPIVYSIDDGRAPIAPADISHYAGTLHQLPVTPERRIVDECTGEWDAQTRDAVPFINDIYVALLADLAAGFGQSTQTLEGPGSSPGPAGAA